MLSHYKSNFHSLMSNFLYASKPFYFVTKNILSWLCFSHFILWSVWNLFGGSSIYPLVSQILMSSQVVHEPQNIHHLETSLLSHSKSGILYVGPTDHPLTDSLRLYSRYVYLWIFLGRASIYFRKFRKVFFYLSKMLRLCTWNANDFKISPLP